MEVILTENNEVGKGKDGVRSEVVDAQLIELKKLAEEQVTGGSEAAEEMLRKDDDLALRRRGHRFIPRCSCLDA